MSYEPVPGTVPFRVIEYLSGLADGSERSTADLAIMLGMENARGLTVWLLPAVNGGALAARVAGPRLTFYRLGDGKQRFPSREGDDPQVTKINSTAVSSIFAFAEQRDAAPFSTAESSDGRLIIQRHGRVIAELTPKEAEIHRQFLAKRKEPETAE